MTRTTIMARTTIFSNIHSNRKAQMHMTETIAVLFVFFVLIVFGLIFYYQYAQGAQREEQQQMRAEKAMLTTLKVLYLPELSCTRGDAEPIDNCIDVMKLNSLNATVKEHLLDYYFMLFGYAHIEAVQLYPQNYSVVIYDKTNADLLNYESTFFVVTFKDDKVGNGRTNYGFGYVEVGVYG